MFSVIFYVIQIGFFLIIGSLQLTTIESFRDSIHPLTTYNDSSLTSIIIE